MAGHPHGDPDFRSPVFQGIIRGMLPWYLLTLLSEGPLHALKMISLMSEMSHGVWKPSPGSVYPILRRLEKQGLITGQWQRNKAAPRRVYRLTQKGDTAVSDMRKGLLAELKKAKHIIDRHIAILQKLADDKS